MAPDTITCQQSVSHLTWMIKRPSDLQVPDVKGLLVDVDGVGPRSQTPNSGQVATVATHGLDDEDPPLGATGRLFDAVTCLKESVQ